MVLWFMAEGVDLCLIMPLVQMDELYARVRGAAGGRWLWMVIDPVSKALPGNYLGGRKAEDGHALVHDFAQHLDPDCWE